MFKGIEDARKEQVEKPLSPLDIATNELRRSQSILSLGNAPEVDLDWILEDLCALEVDKFVTKPMQFTGNF